MGRPAHHRRSLAGNFTALSLLVVAAAVSGCASTSGGRGGIAGGAGAQNGRGYEVREANTELSQSGAGDVQLEHGVIASEAAQEAVMKRWSALTRCYGDAGEAMTFAGGAVTLRFVVKPDGSTSDVRVADSRLGNFAVERCLITVGRTVAFPRPEGGAEATVDYTLEFRSTGETPVMELATAPVAAELPSLMANVAVACPNLGADELSMTLYIGPRGAVRSVGFASAEAVDADALACVATAVHQWTIPTAAPGGRTIGRVTMPLRSQDLIAAREAPQASRRVRLTTARSRRR
jgi:hypothetical protein